MTIERSQIFLASFVVLVAWGLVARLVPVVKHIANAFLLGLATAPLLLLFFVLTTARHVAGGARVPHRPVPAFLVPETWHADRERQDADLAYNAIQLHPTSFEVSEAIGQLINLALRNFISSWYKAISQSPAFVNEVDKNIRVALIEIRDRILSEDMVDVVVARIIPIVTAHLRDFDNAERAVRGRVSNRNMPDPEELDLAVAAKYKEGQLHPAASLAYSSTKSLQQQHFRKTLVWILPLLLDEKMIRSRAVSVLVREIVSCALLFPVFQMLADPDTWNQIVEAYGKTTLQDRKTVKRMRAALDEHTSPATKRQTQAEMPRLQAHDSERAFERFVRAIRKTRTLADARRFRSLLASQLARERLVEGQDPVYLRRLEMGKRVLDQKIAKMTSSASSSIHSVPPADQRTDDTSPAHNWSLVEIMHTTSGLSYFMEFMDRQSKMSLVQFWINVDGFRNPLEDDFGEEQSTSTMTWSDTDRLDIAQIAETYIMRRELSVPKEFQDAVQRFLVAGRTATPEQYRAARMAILSSQSAVLETLEQKYLPAFRKSDLYYKFLASDEGKPRQRQQSIAVNGNSDAGLGIKPAPLRPKVLAPPLARASSQMPTIKTRDLRRAALSSSDVKSLAKSSESLTPMRRSLDVDKPLFDDDINTDPLALSVQSIGSESINGDFNAESEVIESMEAALTDIMMQSPNTGMSDFESDALFASPNSDRKPNQPADSPQGSTDLSRELPRLDSATGEKVKPSLATLGLVNASGRIGVFQDNDLFADEAKFAEDEYADHDEDNRKKNEEEVEIHQAAPGDLGLAEAITALSDDIERLVSQEAVVDTLTRKAELTNNVAELRILGKSKASLQREIRRKELQRQQYIVQESDNSLYGRASINIKSVMVGHEDDGQEYAVYVIEVQRRAGDQMPAASWAIAHRYSEFHDLHTKLRKRYPSTRNLEFPRRRMVMKLQKQFLHNRRVALEAYLQQLLRMPDVCRSREFRSFLSQQAISSHPDSNGNRVNAANAQDIVTRIYNSVTDGMDEFLGNTAVLDSLSVAGQNLMSAATTQINTSGASPNATNRNQDEVIAIEPNSMAEAEAELRAFEDKELEPFVKPICDVFLETFDLNRGNNWLRGRAVVVVLHQLLGGTVERKVRDAFAALFTDDALLKYIEITKTTMFPLVSTEDTNDEKITQTERSEERETRQPGSPRTKLQKDASRHEAAAVLNTLIPELVGSVVGRSNAATASRRIVAVMNNRRLNEHLVLTIFDEIIGVLFHSTGVQSRVRDKPGKA
ncbi:tRNA (guanine-N(7)-)-methyltransferase (tRNA(m7G46)-methyltransferase) [Neophaeococcomyces mojaviensis]|uniref:tRNA (Guanine-N(7)-)-methyltransferase (tRNA(m7G46)-methyltransferase) n=1 Tax=Neophaeococcomyces mojaviensis TaxID=3383035 RepID=A0ACC3A944_9EURO|nr:tRNA (guanine-N(7)-)-methyltransferase (tRNA(m7G46)-methyltransferase) [Knufia sp. JES_112]